MKLPNKDNRTFWRVFGIVVILVALIVDYILIRINERAAILAMIFTFFIIWAVVDIFIEK